jgi:mannitol/fructose-specific phosphotransferase system IIA component (Ntr-type)
VLGIGRSAKGIQFGEATTPVKLIFLIGVPQRMVNDYLVCVGAIARLVKNKDTHSELLNAQRPETFVELLRAGALSLEQRS